MTLSRVTSSQPGITISLNELIKLQDLAHTIELYSQKKVSTLLLGGHHSSLRGRGIDFDEVRNYQAGDDIRHMDWRVTARSGKPHTKLFHEERERPVFLVIDLSPSMFFGTRVAFKSIIAAQLAAILGWAAIQHGDRLGAVIFTAEQQLELKPRTRKQGILPILKALTSLTVPKSFTSTEYDFGTALKCLHRVAKPGSLIFLISDFYQSNDLLTRELLPLAKQCEIVACGITDPIEREAPPPNRYAISNQQTVIQMDTRKRQFRTAYSEQFKLHWQRLQNGLRQYQIPLLTFSTDQSVISQLQGATL